MGTRFYYNQNGKLSELGRYVWNVYGEDPNPDLHGPHHNAFLGRFVGSAKEAMEYASKMPRFFEWGAGGYIELAEAETKFSESQAKLSESTLVEIKNLVTLIDQLKGHQDIPQTYAAGNETYLKWKTYFNTLEEEAREKKEAKKNELMKQLDDIQKKLKELE